MDYEKLGIFYLGKEYDLKTQKLIESPILYESKDLTTHAICVGMTGSGKTGLCLSLLEEAAIDGIPVIAIDPKGDLSNLLLTFPNLQPADFRPWIDEDEALRNACTPAEYAIKVAKQWSDGLTAWEQNGERVGRFKDSVDISIYTPGSTAGLPLTVLRSFTAPTEEFRADSDAFRERINASVSSLLTLLGIDADPIRCREHILLSNIVRDAWQKGQDLNIPSLIRLIQVPGFDKIGFMDLESIFPSADRSTFAMQLNNLLASPSFAAWMEGEPLNIERMLMTPQGKPRISIMSIAHLSDSERMFFVTILLNEILAWVRSQPGTSSLRAILYMDEVFGYFPPTANPPSKQPMLTLLKQARAFGLGIVLATQNPVDLDYKGLSNTGTWFLGRLQTERDKMRLLDGLESATANAGHGFDRASIEKILSSLGKRTFLLHNVHEDHPIVFQTRWALSYLRGPMTRQQISQLMTPKKAAAIGNAPAAATPMTPAQVTSAQVPVAGAKPQVSTTASTPVASSTGPDMSVPPLIPSDLSVRIVMLQKPLSGQTKLIYRPAYIARGKLHYTDVKSRVSYWSDFRKILPAMGGIPEGYWDESQSIDTADLEYADDYESRAVFDELPGDLIRKSTFTTLEKELKAYLYRAEELVLWLYDDLKSYSEPEESESAFRNRLIQQLREQRDLDMEKIRTKFAPKISVIKDRIRRAEERVEKEKEQVQQQSITSGISIGTSILSAIFGRKLSSRTNVNSAGSAIKNATKISKERSDVSRAMDNLQVEDENLQDLEHELEVQLKQMESLPPAEKIPLSEYRLRPKKTDITIDEVSLAWLPWGLKATGMVEPLYISK
jgi:hypothetical protein